MIRTIHTLLFFITLLTFNTLAEDLKMDISRVFMHQPGDYSIMYSNQVNKIISVEKINGSWIARPGQRGTGVIGSYLKRNFDWIDNFYSIEQILIADVPADKPMFLVIKHVGRGKFKVSIHIHTVRDVGGGEWETSQTGSHRPRGQTRVIE